MKFRTAAIRNFYLFMSFLSRWSDGFGLVFYFDLNQQIHALLILIHNFIFYWH